MKHCFVGIDTSNYTTSVAIANEAGEILANIKRPLPVKAGECGLRQSDAVFAHVKNLPDAMMEAKRILSDGYELRAIGVSATPRDAKDSYMPCFLAGIGAAESMSAATGAPVFRFSHQNGHVMAAAYSSGRMEDLLKAPFAAFHVSGGTTEMLYVTPHQNGFDVKLVGETLDLNAGQAIDRVGVMMGLSFPCGKELETLAAQNTKPIPRPRVSVKDGGCHLSGLQNLAEKLWNESKDSAYVSAFVLAFLGETLKRMTAYLDTRYPEIPIVYAGGVMSNRYLQGVLGARPNTCFAEPQFSADNAAGTALLCRRSALNL